MCDVMQSRVRRHQIRNPLRPQVTSTDSESAICLFLSLLCTEPAFTCCTTKSPTAKERAVERSVEWERATRVLHPLRAVFTGIPNRQCQSANVDRGTIGVGVAREECGGRGEGGGEGGWGEGGGGMERAVRPAHPHANPPPSPPPPNVLHYLACPPVVSLSQSYMEYLR